MKLSQSRGVLRIDSEILSDGVFYRERGLLSSNETKIPFEHIAGELVRTFHVPRLYLFISVFFALAFGYRLVRFVSTDTVSLLSLVWSGILFLVPTFGTWMQSPRYVGYLTSRGGLLFFDKQGAQDPSRYLEEIQHARERYFHAQDRRGLNGHSGDESDPHRSSVH